MPLHVRGRDDAAQTTDDNRRHWANADMLSADAANNPRVRTILRNRARYEVANNSYARGIVLTIANDCIGTGPRLQMITDDDESNRLVEQEFMLWADAIGLAEKLARCGWRGPSPARCSPCSWPIRRWIRPLSSTCGLIEADQVMTPVLLRQEADLLAIDGIIFDEHGNPIEYHVSSGIRATISPAGRLILTGCRPPPWSITSARNARARTGESPRSRRRCRSSPSFVATPWRSLPPPKRPPTSRPSSIPMRQPTARRPTWSRWTLWNSSAHGHVLPGGWRLGQIQAEQPSTTYGEFKRKS